MPTYIITVPRPELSVGEVAVVAEQPGAVKYFQLFPFVTQPYPCMTETPSAPTPVTQLLSVPLLNFFTALLPLSAIYSTAPVMWYETPSGEFKPVLTSVVSMLEVGATEKSNNNNQINALQRIMTIAQAELVTSSKFSTYHSYISTI